MSHSLLVNVHLNNILTATIGESNGVSDEMTAPWSETRLATILSNYVLADIYKADEFPLLYQALPSKTMHFKNEKCIGGKFSTQR